MSDLSDQMIDELQQAAIGHLEDIINTLVNAAEKEAAKSRDKISMLEQEVSFIRDKLAERDAHIAVLRGDIQRQSGTVKRLIEERDEARKLLAEVKQERDHWLRKCKEHEPFDAASREHEAASRDSEVELLALRLFTRDRHITPPMAFLAAEHFLSERDSRRKKAEAKQ